MLALLFEVCANPEGSKYDAAIKWKIPGLALINNSDRPLDDRPVITLALQ
jgi:hypothetical protein